MSALAMVQDAARKYGFVRKEKKKSVTWTTVLSKFTKESAEDVVVSKVSLADLVKIDDSVSPIWKAVTEDDKEKILITTEYSEKEAVDAGDIFVDASETVNVTLSDVSSEILYPASRRIRRLRLRRFKELFCCCFGRGRRRVGVINN